MKVIKITSPGCSSCIFINKILEEIQELEIVSYDYYEDNEIVKELNIGRVLPVLIFINNGKEVARLSGEHTKKEILEIVNGAV